MLAQAAKAAFSDIPAVMEAHSQLGITAVTVCAALKVVTSVRQNPAGRNSEGGTLFSHSDITASAVARQAALECASHLSGLQLCNLGGDMAAEYEERLKAGLRSDGERLWPEYRAMVNAQQLRR